MDRIFNNSRLAFFFYIITAIVLYQFYKYVIAQDELSYITIAIKYSNGNFKDAINGIWSPLISWLLVPFIILKIFPPFAFKLIQIVIGFFVLLVLSKLLRNLKVEEFTISISLLILSIIVLFFVFFTGTPDLLSAFLWLLYIYLLVKYNFTFSLPKAVVIGLIGVLIYFSKAYGFPFFLLHFTILNLVLLIKLKEKRKKIIKYYSIAMLVFGLLSTGWIYLISVKYGNLTYSLAGDYNYNFAGPIYNKKQIMRIETLYPPANETAISYWEDPSFLIIKQWSPFKSYSNIIYQLKLILINTKIAIYHFAVYLFLLFLLFIFYPQKKELLKNRKLLLIIFSFLIYLPGLLLIMIEERFLIFPIIMLFTIIIFLASAIINKYIENKSKTFLIVFLISFIMIAKPIYSFVKNFNYGKSIHQLSLEIKNDTKLVGNIASRSEMPLNEDWSNSTYIAYVNSSKYFGEVKRNFTFEELVQELKKFDINYFFVWDKPIPLEQPKFILEKHYKISTTPVISNQIIDSAVTTIFNIFGLKNQRINKTKELWIYKFSKL